MNFFRGPVEFDGEQAFTRFAGSRVPLPASPARLAALGGGEAYFGIRPEHLTIGRDGGTPLQLGLVESLGTEKILHFEMSADQRINTSAEAIGAESGEREREGLLARVIDDRRYRSGETVQLGLPADKIHIFEPGTHRVIQ
jgi:multiple sugar transport system ATP-binding protein